MDQPAARRATWRIDARMRYRIQWIVVAVICALLAFALWPQVVHLQETRNLQVCETNMRKLATALTMYKKDWDDTLPPGSTWMTGLSGAMAPISKTGFALENYFHCPLDKSGSPSSYCYNDLLEGINPAMASKDKTMDDRRLSVRNPDRMPLIFEKYGSAENAHVRIDNYDAFFGTADRKHSMPESTTVIITAGGNVERRTEEQLLNLKGKKF